MTGYQAIRLHQDNAELRAILTRIYTPKNESVSVWDRFNIVGFCPRQIEMALLAGLGVIIGAGIALATEGETFRTLWRPSAIASVEDARTTGSPVCQLERLMFYNGAAFQQSVVSLARDEPQRSASPHSEHCNQGSACNEPVSTASSHTGDYAAFHQEPSMSEKATANDISRNATALPPPRHLPGQKGDEKGKRTNDLKKKSSSLSLPNRTTSDLSGIGGLRREPGRLVAGDCKKPILNNDCASSRAGQINQSQDLKKKRGVS